MSAHRTGRRRSQRELVLASLLSAPNSNTQPRNGMGATEAGDTR